MLDKLSVITILLILLVFTSCKTREISPEEKAKVGELTMELENTKKEISEANIEDEKYQGGLIKLLIQSRIEILKISKALIEQRINAIESGSPVNVVTSIVKPNPELAMEIKKEIESVIQQIDVAKSEAEKYSGGLIYSLKLSEVATYEQTLAMLRQKYLEAEYGLIVSTLSHPEITNEINNQAKATNITPPPKAENSMQEEVEETGNFDFRKTKWGMTRDEVKASEKSQPSSESETEVDYKGNVGSLDAIIGFVFIDNKLYRAGYLFQQQHTNKNDYIVGYNNIKEILSRKYGKPVEDRVIWSDSLYRDKPEDYGFAVSLGHLSYYSEWKTPSTTIMLSLHGDNYEIAHLLVYESIELKSLGDSQQKTKEEKEF